MSCDIGHRYSSHCTLLWHRPAAATLIQPLAWELPYAMGISLKRQGGGKKWHTCLFPNLKESTFNFSPLSMMLAVGLLYAALIMLRYVPSIINLLRFFIINGCWILSKTFTACIKMILWFYSSICLCGIEHGLIWTVNFSLYVC